MDPFSCVCFFFVRLLSSEIRWQGNVGKAIQARTIRFVTSPRLTSPQPLRVYNFNGNKTSIPTRDQQIKQSTSCYELWVLRQFHFLTPTRLLVPTGPSLTISAK